MAKNIGYLGKYDMWKLICIANPFDPLFKQFTNQFNSLSLDNNLKWGGGSLWNVFLKYTLYTIIGTPRNA